MEHYSTRYTSLGMKTGAVAGFLAAGVLMIASRSFWFWHHGGHFYYRFTGFGLRLVPFVLAGGAIFGAFAGGLAGAFLDKLADWRKRGR